MKDNPTSHSLAADALRTAIASFPHGANCGKVALGLITRGGTAMKPFELRVRCVTCGESLTLPTGADFMRAWTQLGEDIRPSQVEAGETIDVEASPVSPESVLTLKS